MKRILTFCHDCGAREGELHNSCFTRPYSICEMETCPICHEQLLGCSCLDGLSEQEAIDKLNKAGRIPWIQYPNICGKCGKLWPEMFRVPDEEWKHYIDPHRRHLLLCRECYDYIKEMIDK